MQVSIFVFAFIVLVFAFRGYKSGVVIVLSRLLGLPLAYLLAWLLAKPVGQSIQSSGLVDGLLAYLLGGSIVFFATYLIVTLSFSFVHKNFVKTDDSISDASAISGALLGGFVGIFIGLLAVWLSNNVKTIIAAKVGKPSPPTRFEKTINEVAASAISRIAIDKNETPNLESLPAVLLANPSENIILMQNISEKGLIQNLLQDNQVKKILDSGSPGALVHTQQFKRLVNDPDLQALAEKMNFSAESGELEKQLAIQLTKTWSQVRAIQTDPQFLQITNDPEVRQLINSKNVFKIINSSKIEQLMSVVSQVEVAEIEFKPMAIDRSGNMRPKEKDVKIHRWVDEKGNVHYSDKDPKTDN